MELSSSGLIAIPETECRALLAAAQIGRVIVSIDALPAAFPVNYQVLGGSIVFRTASGTKLTSAVNRAVVGFEVDEIDPVERTGWSVLVVGMSRVVTDPDEVARLDRSGIPTWLKAIPPHYVRIDLDRVTGRRLVDAPVSHAATSPRN